MTGPRSLLTRPGLATRLYIAIGAAVTLTLVASVVAWISFIELGEQQDTITSRYLPAITLSLQLSRQSALIAATAPTLLTDTNQEERTQTLADLDRLETELVGQLNALETVLASEVADRGDYNPLANIWGRSRRLFGSVSAIGESVGELQALEDQLTAEVNQAVAAHRRMSELIVPLVDDTTFYLVTGLRSLDDEAPVPLDERVDEEALAAFGALAELQAEANLAIGLLTEASITSDAALLQPLRERFDASADRFVTAMANLGALPHAAEIDAAFQELLGLGQADDNIIELRGSIIDNISAAEGLVENNRALAASLTREIDRIVEAQQNGTRTALAAANAAEEFSSELLLWLNGGAILGAVIIGWLYVKRSFTDPVVQLTAAAESFEHHRFDQNSLADTEQRYDELGHLARTFARMAKEVQARTDTLDRLVAERTQQLNEKNEALERSLTQIAEELTIAQRMQLSILPHHPPSVQGLELSAHMHAAREVGGDFYDFIELDKNHIGIVVADVSDKGVPAALLMAVCYTMIRSVALRERSPSKVMKEVNQALSHENDTMMFVTAFYGIMDVETGTFTFANAGHDAPLLHRSGHATTPLPRLKGTALGVIGEAEYRESSLELCQGDAIVFYTDGVTEAFNHSNDAFTVPRLRKLLDDSGLLTANQLCGLVVDSVKSHADGAPQSDDMTCVVLRVAPDTVARDEGASDVSVDTKDRLLVVKVEPDLSDIPRLAEKVENFAEGASVPPRLVQQINIVLDELVSNAIRHGGADGKYHRIEVRLRLHDDKMVVTIEDDTGPFDPRTIPPPDLDQSLEDRPIGGVGLHLVRTMMDGFDYERDGEINRVTLTKNISP
ncbi:MAG: SpoIIE family protein phosphatase [Pseudomonadota bacterium]